jgi:hypothetical protein
MAALDFGSFTAAEKTALLTAAKAEMLRRAGGGAVQTGAENGSSFSVTKMTENGLITLINALTQELGYQQPIVTAVPNFSGINYAWPGA